MKWLFSVFPCEKVSRIDENGCVFYTYMYRDFTALAFSSNYNNYPSYNLMRFSNSISKMFLKVLYPVSLMFSVQYYIQYLIYLSSLTAMYPFVYIGQETVASRRMSV